MSQIYLTKIERKTIFTKSFIFVLVMFIISDLTVTGPFWFNFIPCLFVLGVISSVKKIDGVLTCIIGTFTVFVSQIITNQTFGASCILGTLSALTQLVMGIISGKCIFEFVLEHRLVKYIKPSRKVILIVSIVMMLVVSFVITGIEKGDFVTYLKSKANLKEYITKTYNITEYEVKRVQYSSKVPGKYVYIVNMQEQEVCFVPMTKLTFKDSNLEERLEKINEKVNANLNEKYNKILSDNKVILNTEQVIFNKEYTKVGVNPDALVVYITCLTSKNDENIYNNIAFVINELCMIEDFERVLIEVDGQNLTITSQDISKVTAEYIKAGFEIEELSDN